jgi:hypothetical protein
MVLTGRAGRGGGAVHHLGLLQESGWRRRSVASGRFMSHLQSMLQSNSGGTGLAVVECNPV